MRYWFFEWGDKKTNLFAASIPRPKKCCYLRKPARWLFDQPKKSMIHPSERRDYVQKPVGTVLNVDVTMVRLLALLSQKFSGEFDLFD